MPAQRSLAARPPGLSRSFDPITLIRTPAWRLHALLPRLASRQADVVAQYQSAVRHLRLHHHTAPVVADTLRSHLRWRLDVAGTALDDHDQLVSQVCRPRSPGWQTTGVAALLMAAGRRSAAEAYVAALPAVRCGEARRRTATRRVVETGVWGSGHARTTVAHSDLLRSTSAPRLHHVAELARRNWHSGCQSDPALDDLVLRLPQRHQWRGRVWQALLAAGPHLHLAERALSAMPHAAARDQLAGLLAEAAVLRGMRRRASNLLDRVRSSGVRASTAVRLCDLGSPRRCVEVDAWLGIVAEGPHARHADTALLLQLEWAAHAGRLRFGPSTLAQASAAARRLRARDATPEMCLQASPSSEARLAAVCAAGWRTTRSLRRLLGVADTGALKHVARRLPSGPGATMVAVAQVSEGDRHISEPLLAEWCRQSPPTRARVGSPWDHSGEADVVVDFAEHVLRRQASYGTATAWRGLCELAAAAGRVDLPSMWLAEHRARTEEWPGVLDIQRVVRARFKQGRGSGRPIEVSPSDPVDAVAMACGLPVERTGALRRGRPWTSLVNQPHVLSLGSGWRVRWADSRRDRWRVLPFRGPRRWAIWREWADPLVQVLVLSCRPGRYAPIDAVCLLAFGLASPGRQPVVLAAPPSPGVPRDVTRALLVHIDSMARRLGAVGTGTTTATARGLGWEPMDGMVVRRAGRVVASQPAAVGLPGPGVAVRMGKGGAGWLWSWRHPVQVAR